MLQPLRTSDSNWRDNKLDVVLEFVNFVKIINQLLDLHINYFKICPFFFICYV
jgi:hypothetical protein